MDVISRQAVKEQMKKYGFHAPDMTVTEFVEDCLPSAEPTVSKMEQVEDCISRRAALASHQRMYDAKSGIEWVPVFWIKNLPSVQPFISDDGTVMISVPKGQLDKVGRVMVNEESTKYCKMMYEPERKKGKWIRHNTYHGDDTSGYVDPDWRCSECGKQAMVNEWMMYDLSDFCPNCGADMRGEK